MAPLWPRPGRLRQLGGIALRGPLEVGGSRIVQVGQRQGTLEIWAGDERIAVHPRAQQAGQRFILPGQWAGLPRGDGRPLREAVAVQVGRRVRAGTELTNLQNAGRWQSPSMPARYSRGQRASRGAVARYYGVDG